MHTPVQAGEVGNVTDQPWLADHERVEQANFDIRMSIKRHESGIEFGRDIVVVEQ
jgi:hypothetical protein